jgi:hypothetical protein
MQEAFRMIRKTGLRPAQGIKVFATAVGLAIALLTSGCSTPISSTDLPEFNLTNGHDADAAEQDR